MSSAAVLALLAAAVDPAMVARGDQLNLEYTECLFATARSAREQGVSNDDFPATLAVACQPERERLRGALVEIMRRRGMSAAEAEREWSRLEAEGRASVERAYALGGQP